MKNNVLNLQDIFLNNARKEKCPLVIYLVNGVQVKGTVKGFDNYVILLEDESGHSSLIYKHAVSTVQPLRPFNISNKTNK
ncbi:RNA chaperone Hfq [Peptacetobacter hominis]|uniref:RNA-binding protein Hfq n=1 Tax=Peptacetobacter hominis TaxID=2743610 RepID=A0A544QVJ7_9FIRM|nr:RNA chaperone Hfq [Peptacetobacter hominis]TQQ84710.1 RNA chaperone Hfq [Peptacetobacter hominis]